MKQITEVEKYRNSLSFLRLYKAFDTFFKFYNTTSLPNVKFKVAKELDIDYDALGIHVINDYAYEVGCSNDNDWDNTRVDITLYYEGLTDCRDEIDFYSRANKTLYESHLKRVEEYEKSIAYKSYQQQVDEILDKLETMNYVGV